MRTLTIAEHPVVLGCGKRLFADGGPMRTMRLIDARATTSGLALLTYRPARGGRPSLDEET